MQPREGGVVDVSVAASDEGGVVDGGRQYLGREDPRQRREDQGRVDDGPEDGRAPV